MKKRILFLTIVIIAFLLIFSCCENQEDAAEDDLLTTEITPTDNAIETKTTTDTPMETESATDRLFSYFRQYGFSGDKEELLSLLSGKSAYMIAVENGFSGTETEWLTSLRGLDGKDGTCPSVNFVGNSLPGANEVSVGELFLEITTLDLYYLSEDGWIKLTNLGKDQTVCLVTLEFPDEESSIKEVPFGHCTDLPALEKTGYDFLGWFTGEGYDEQKITSSFPIVKDMVLRPKFALSKYKLSYFIEGEGYEEQYYYYNEVIVPPDEPDVSGFVDWKDLPVRMPAENIFVEANINGRYQVVFMDGSTVLKTEYVQEGEGATPPVVPEKTGYFFIGWDNDYTFVDRDLTLSAVYEEKSFTVRFYGSDNNIIKEESVLYGRSATAPTPENKEGFDFSNWDVDFSSVTSDLTVRPIYTQTEQQSDRQPEFFVRETYLYLREKDAETKVVLSDNYLTDTLCQELLNNIVLDPSLFSMTNEVRSSHLSDFIENGICSVPLLIRLNGQFTECFVEVDYLS